MIDSAGHRWSTSTSDVTNEHVFAPTSSEASILELNVKPTTVYETSPIDACNIDTGIISNSSSIVDDDDTHTPLRQSSETNHNQNGIVHGAYPLGDYECTTESARDDHIVATYSDMVTSLPENHHNEFQNMIGDSETIASATTTSADDDDAEYGEEERGDNEDEDEDDDDENEVDEDDSSNEEDGDQEDEEEEESEDEDDDDSENSEDIVDPGQHCQLDNQHAVAGVVNENFAECDDRESNDILDGERMLEVTRKLVRNTERDPDRDLRKQVLLKTAIKKLPHFMEYNRYSDSLERCPNGNISPQTYYESHDSQQKFYHPVQPNAIQMSTTSLRMLDLNDDHDPELINIEQEQDPHLGYNARASLEQHDYVQSQYDRYHHRTHDPTQYEHSNHMIGRHNSLDNLYQPINGGDMSVDIKDGDERIPIAFQIACEIYDFTCNPDDNDRKLLDNLAHDYYPPKSTKEIKSDANVVADRDGLAADDQDGSDGGSNSNSSTTSSTDESASSIVSNDCSVEADEVNGTSLLETSLNSEHSDFYHSSHDSGVVLFSPRTNKRSSSSIGLDDEMDIDHLTELPIRSPSLTPNNQYKKLRKRETID